MSQQPIRDFQKEREQADARKRLQSEIQAHEQAVLDEVEQAYAETVAGGGDPLERSRGLFTRLLRIHACIIGLRRALEAVDGR